MTPRAVLTAVEGGVTEADFGSIFAKLALQLRWIDADILTIRSYFEVLRSYPRDVISAAADQFSREPGRKFPPTSAEWWEAARDVAADLDRRRLVLPPGRDQPWQVECVICQDTGWVQDLTCDGGAEAWPETGPPVPRGRSTQPVGWRAQPRKTATPQASVCGRTRPHLPHDYTMPCGCRATNRTYQRHQRLR